MVKDAKGGGIEYKFATVFLQTTWIKSYSINSKILKTRAKIKKKHAQSSIKNQKNAMAIIPVRGSLYDKNCVAEAL